MLNRTPPNKPINTTNVINSYRKRRMQRGPILVYGAVGLVVIGLILLVVWLMQPDQLIGTMLATDTPTPTSTSTPTNTAVPTSTATITSTPTVTLTATPSEPFSYIVQENDSLFSIADQNSLGNNGILFLLLLNPEIDQCNPNLQVGDTIQIPNPGAQIPTSTPVPPELSRGTKVTYLVQSGDTLAGVAAIFNSKTDEILKANELTDPNAINVGQCLTIPVNLVTPTATLPSTSTPVTPTIEGQPTLAPAAATSTPGIGGSTACTGTGNAGFVTELQTLINDERAKNSLPALTVNQKLVSSANAYATDMLCNNYFSPVGLDGSTAKSRATVQGYSASVIVENLYALHPVYGITPQLAFNWWMKNPEYSANILNPNMTEMGVTYVSDENTLFGAYFVATFAKP